MDIFKGLYKCEQCGEFEWKARIMDNSDFAFGDIMNKNIQDIEKCNGKCIIYVKCPKCGKVYKIEK